MSLLMQAPVFHELVHAGTSIMSLFIQAPVFHELVQQAPFLFV